MTSPAEGEPDASTTAARPAGVTDPVPPPSDQDDGTTSVRQAISDRTAPRDAPSERTHVLTTEPTAPFGERPGPPGRGGSPPAAGVTPTAAPESSTSRRALAIVGALGALIIALAAGAIWFAVDRTGGGQEEAGPIPQGPEIPPVTATMLEEATVSLSVDGARVTVDPLKATTGLDPEASTESSGN